jgi:hypothetical protein
MTRDPIIEDVRSARQKIFDACNEDLDALLDRFQEHEKLDQERVVSDIVTQAKQDTEGLEGVRL